MGKYDQAHPAGQPTPEDWQRLAVLILMGIVIVLVVVIGVPLDGLP